MKTCTAITACTLKKVNRKSENQALCRLVTELPYTKVPSVAELFPSTKYHILHSEHSYYQTLQNCFCFTHAAVLFWDVRSHEHLYKASLPTAAEQFNSIYIRDDEAHKGPTEASFFDLDQNQKNSKVQKKKKKAVNFRDEKRQKRHITF